MTLAYAVRKLDELRRGLSKALGRKSVDWTADTADEKTFWEAIRFLVEEAGFDDEPCEPTTPLDSRDPLVICNKRDFLIDVSVFGDDPPDDKCLTASWGGEAVRFHVKLDCYPDKDGIAEYVISEEEQQPEPAW